MHEQQLVVSPYIVEKEYMQIIYSSDEVYRYFGIEICHSEVLYEISLEILIAMFCL